MTSSWQSFGQPPSLEVKEMGVSQLSGWQGDWYWGSGLRVEGCLGFESWGEIGRQGRRGQPFLLWQIPKHLVNILSWMRREKDTRVHFDPTYCINWQPVYMSNSQCCCHIVAKHNFLWAYILSGCCCCKSPHIHVAIVAKALSCCHCRKSPITCCHCRRSPNMLSLSR